MRPKLSQIVKEAMEAPIKDYQEVIENATELLRNENGEVDNLCILGRCVQRQPRGDAVIIGDLHGDLESLVHILQESAILNRMEESADTSLIFLGDYGDRGNLSPEVYYTILRLKTEFKHQIILMRGNHEGPKDLMASPHDLPLQLRSKFGPEWSEVYDRIVDLFPHLYTSVVVKGQYLMVHGGMPEKACSLEDFAFANKKHPETRMLEEILWSDPTDSLDGACPSPRGAGKLFGKDVTIRVTEALAARVVIRSHESCAEGYRIDHGGRILTLFSRKGSPYFNENGAYLDPKLSRRFQKADQLVPFVHKF